MAVTISNPCPPEGWMPSAEDIIFTITSNVSNLNYFLIEVYVNGMNVITLRKVPITNNSIPVNLKDILNNFLETQNPYNSNYLGWANTSSKTVLNTYIEVYEHYNGDDYGPTRSIPINVWKSAVEHLERYSIAHLYDFDKKFTINQGKQFMGVKAVPDNSILFLQSGTIHLSLPYAQYQWYHQTRYAKKPISMFIAGTSTVYQNIIGFDADGKAIKKLITGISHSTDDTNHHLYRNYIDGVNFNRAAYIYPDGIREDTKDCAYIVFYYSSTYNRNLSTLDTLVSCPVILKICDASESWNIYYVSKDGGVSMIQANHRVTQKTSYKTSTKENLPAMREISSVNMSARSSWTLNTQWLNPQQNEEVKDMLESPEIWICHRKDNKDTWIPVILSDSEFTTEEHNSHRLFQYNITFDEAFYKNTLK